MQMRRMLDHGPHPTRQPTSAQVRPQVLERERTALDREDDPFVTVFALKGSPRLRPRSALVGRGENAVAAVFVAVGVVCTTLGVVDIL